MTDQQHPITPPPELVLQWVKQWHQVSHKPNDLYCHIATAAAQWGADAELKACCALMDDWGLDEADLRAARRPKPPSLKEQALADLEQLLDIAKANGVFNPPDTIRRALEQLND
jgi:hypothetical protein